MSVDVAVSVDDQARSPQISAMALTRDINPMPDWIRGELVSHGVLGAYEARPDYQRNDYLGWIERARREETRRKRLDQMLDELERGGVYMRMAWRG